MATLKLGNLPAGLGGWVLGRGAVRLLGQRRTAWVERDGERVYLRHCSRELDSFVRALESIEEDFSRRCSN